MKNILLIMPYGSVGGMERLAITFYNHYKSLGYTVKALKIIKLESDIIHFGEDELHLSTVDFAGMSGPKRMLFYLNAPLEIRKIVKKYQITHSIAFGDMANVFSSLSLTGEFKVASIHALKSVEFSNTNFLNRIFKLAFKTSYVAFDRVVCISEAIRKDLLENCGFAFPKKLQVIYNPHDIRKILSMAEELLPASDEAIFSRNTILFLGRLSIQKAPWHLIKAFYLLRREMPDAKLVFIGDGDKNVEDYITKLIRKLGLETDVIFLGRKSNPYQYLKKARILALSSFYEGTPNVIVEAMALGVPVVSSNCTDGIGELMSLQQMEISGEIILTESGIITPGFFKGTLSIPENEDTIPEEIVFSDALRKVLENDSFREKLAASRPELLEKFDLERVAAAYLAPNES